MSSHETMLRQILDDAQKPEWEKAVEALQMVFAWCVEAATPEKVTSAVTGHSTERMQALMCLLQLSKALAEGTKYLRLLPTFFEVAVPGDTLRSSLLNNQDILQRKEQELSRIQADIEKLVEQEEVLKKQAEETEKLQQVLAERKENLERLTRIADPQVVQALQMQVNELEERMSPEGKEVEQLEGKILEEAGRLIVLQEEHLKGIHPQVVSSLEQAEAKEQELRELSAKLQESRERYDRASSEVERLEKELKPYIEADCMIAQALPEAKGVLDLLRRAESLIKTAEEALKHAIEEGERNAQRPPLSITGEVISR